MDALLETPLSMHGTISKDGEMLSFVAEGLTDMIKRSSPMSRSRTESSVSSWSVGPSGAQTPSGHSISSVDSSASGWDSSASSMTGYSYSGLSRSASELTQSPDDIPPIDPRALMDLEVLAEKTSMSLQHMMSTLASDLHKMSSLTHACLGAYSEGVDNTCDAVDSSIKSMYALMAKCEELNSSLRPIYGLQEQM
ncbi:hypothetical protein CAPTEDRAFT_167972 [Capitella teleta]|uniref:BLOC-1-related complex subunit 6 C-terminal helix domain-containing protein n=1 Tax=Capitella teleta TaxID=283909 RepID=R7T737_CAPTE|nr:hypothetical protein CAPTEDRAFT_167972 [Capitella teleta]|eukprot:ELT89444.1 hypothetical protein CAPTEDRAFT_167972 [Capitella teleta]